VVPGHSQLPSLSVNLYNFKFKHLIYLHDMLNKNKYLNTSKIEMVTLPKIGYIAMIGDQPIAAGFLRRLEPCYAQIDTLTSNPYFGSQARHEAVKLVVDALIQEAKALKLKGIISHTMDNGILMRAADLGFHVVPETIIALPLESNE
jgi:hypothetical protein